MIYLTQNKWWYVQNYDISVILYLLIDRYDITTNTCFIWENDQNLTHRNYDLPAVIFKNGYVSWWKNGERL